MKRFLAILLAVVMTVGVCLPAYAAEEKGSITIDDAVVGQEYTVYQLLYLESYNAATGAYAYKANTAWAEWLETQEGYVKFDGQGYVTWVADNADDVAEFAVAAQAYAKENNIAPSADPVTATSSTVEFKNLGLGYYLVDTTLGTICSLDTTNPDVTMEEKNSEPTIKKEVQEDSNGAWGAVNDADINQVVNYKVTVTVRAGAENYVVHDTMSEGLTYLKVDSVTVNDVEVAAANYTVTAPEGCTDGCTFEVAFTNSYIGSLDAGTEIVISYSARLNEDAVVGIEGNPNSVTLQYGDKNKVTHTPPIEVVTHTWDAKIVKFTMKDGQEVALAGATFKLSTDKAGENVLKFHSLGNNEYEMCAKVDCTKEHVAEITTDATGTFGIEGLDAGTYYLTEIKAPAGYNALAGPVELVITGAEADEDGELTYTTVEKKVENKTGTILPETGGMGTMILYGIGALLVIGAAVLLVTRRRAGSEE